MNMDAYISGITFVLPECVVTNQQLQEENPDWEVARIESKTGIKARHIAAENETALDLAVLAGKKLIQGLRIDPATIDTLLLCTQSPDFALPATACILQDKLGLPTTCAALDFNQGCSGYIYGLYLAKALVASESAKNVLLITSETYSKYIHPRDRSVRVLFGDGATATLITADSNGARIGACVLGTDGAGWNNLIVPAGRARSPYSDATKKETTDESGCTRSPENLFMDGQELFAFTLKRIPPLVEAILEKSKVAKDDVQWFVMHQANTFMNEHLRVKLKVPKERAPLCMEDVGNTVSCTIPLAMCRVGKSFQTGDKVMLVGFGVGYSWGATMLDWNDVKLVL